MRQNALIVGIVIVVVVVLGYVLFQAGLWPYGGSEETTASTREETNSSVSGSRGETSRFSEPLTFDEAPIFDIVRVEPGGDAVIAGRGPANAQITLLVNGVSHDQVIADDRGEWTITTTQPLPIGSARFSLLARMVDGREIASEQTVAVNVLESNDQLPLAVLHEDGKPSRIIQEPESSISGDGEELFLKILDYSEDGGLILSGVGLPKTLVRVNLDDGLLGETSVGEDSKWTFQAENTIEPGLYRLRLEQFDSDGEMIAQIELPFEQAEHKIIAAIQPGEIIVQPGNSLWRISRRIYGKGVQYTVIYRANSDQISNPDLIYPGQVFTIP